MEIKNGQEEFTLKKPSMESVDTRCVLEVIGLLHDDKIPKNMLDLLCEALPSDALDGDYNEKFNLREELNCQIKVVRGLRKEIFYPNGSLKEDYGVDDASRILNASRDLLKVLQTQHDELITYERIQAIETAFLDAIAEMPTEIQERYRDSLERHLEKHSPG